MFDISWSVVVGYLLIEACAGTAIGALTGLVASLALKLKIRGISTIKDGLLGALGFLVGFIGTPFVPWHQNTITYRVDNTVVTSTMNTYQHPGWVACAIAILLPLVRAIYRYRSERAVARIR
jgi:hypothetical protein